MRVLTVTATAAGRRLADRLPYEHAHGDAATTVRARWRDYDAFVIVLATSAAVRIVAPLLSSKDREPAIVCLDESGAFAIALMSGVRAEANDLTREVATITGAQPVVTTSSERAGIPALESIDGFWASGDVAVVSRVLVDGAPIEIRNPLDWPLPRTWLDRPSPDGSARPLLFVTDEAVDPESLSHPAVVVNPPSLIVGVGTSAGAPVKEVARLVSSALEQAGLAPKSVAEVVTVDRRANDPAVLGLGMPVRSFSEERLAGVALVGKEDHPGKPADTPSICEASAVLAAGAGASLVVAKRASRHSTCAIARRRTPRGSLSVVGLGPGSSEHRTPAATAAIRQSDVVVGYERYIDSVRDLIGPSQQVVTSELGAESERARAALEIAASGVQVALVCSGDPGIYAMASSVLELAAMPAFSDIDVYVIPGVTAALASAALLGAPLGNDFATISLSDLLTPWEVVEARLESAASADLVVVLYNPRSARRDWQLERAREILLTHRKPGTPVGVVTDAGRPGQSVLITSLGEFDTEEASMTSCVLIGCSTTTVVSGRMVTPRGYDG